MTVASPPIYFPEDFFTIEFWAKTHFVPEGGGFHFLFSLRPSSWTASSFPDLSVGVYVSGATATATLDINSPRSEIQGTALATDQWVHFAVSRYGTSLFFFVQGVRASTFVLGTLGSSSSVFRVGDDFGASNAWQGASIADFRVVKGTALYT